MRTTAKIVAALAIAGLVTRLFGILSAQAEDNTSALSVGIGNSRVHILPTTSSSRLAGTLADTGPLLYHGGRIMLSAKTFAIFWLPRRLQNGAPSFMSASYRPIIKRFLTDYPGHGIDNNSTQYYQDISGVTKYVHNAGRFSGAFFDTSRYPASGCTDSATPGNCLTDAQIRREIEKVIALKAWPVGFSDIFLLFTSRGEGSCINTPSGPSCAYTGYCGYHGHIGIGSTPIIYVNQPYSDPSFCQVGLAPSPNDDPDADAAVSIASHEITEAVTDPLLNAWFTAQGNEIGDPCAYNYGELGWDSGNANQMWNGHFYLLQQEFDNFASACVQIGP